MLGHIWKELMQKDVSCDSSQDLKPHIPKSPVPREVPPDHSIVETCRIWLLQQYSESSGALDSCI